MCSTIGDNTSEVISVSILPLLISALAEPSEARPSHACEGLASPDYLTYSLEDKLTTAFLAAYLSMALSCLSDTYSSHSNQTEKNRLHGDLTGASAS